MLVKLFSSQYNCDQDNSIQLALGHSQHQILLLQPTLQLFSESKCS